MDAAAWVAIGMGILTIITGIIGYLLSRKDAAQEQEIMKLWEKHDEDARKLAELQREMDRNYYPKTELDVKFDKIEGAISSGLTGVMSELKTLNATFMQHMSGHSGGGQ